MDDSIWYATNELGAARARAWKN
jgi:hypothetical protein